MLKPISIGWITNCRQFQTGQSALLGTHQPLIRAESFQGGADGVLISGCVPEMCHYKEAIWAPADSG
jgi:coenzyme F420-reducing hydrogenase delta subunit